MKLDESLEKLIEKAKDIHGHLGPFLVLGIKMSIAGMERLGVEEGTHKLRVEAKSPRKVPYTCMLDGIQATTRCTFGNQKLILKEANSLTISAKFILNDSDKQVEISVRNEILQTLMEKLNNSADATQEELAWMVASMPENKLFSVRIQ